MMTFNKSGLDNILQQTQFQKLFNIPKLNEKYNTTPTSFCADSDLSMRQSQFLAWARTSKGPVSEVTGKIGCQSAVPNPSCNNVIANEKDLVAAHQDLNSKDEVECMEIDYEVEEQEDNLNEVDVLIEDSEDQNNGGDDLQGSEQNHEQDYDVEEDTMTRLVKSYQGIRYFIISVKNVKCPPGIGGLGCHHNLR
ncbi:hypothetical protein MIR68_009754 [Amoeboaphelidium protococcarum]|nr:hypothetical protein MIR68_009754 [Amoeboaphelidium protococcarum]